MSNTLAVRAGQIERRPADVRQPGVAAFREPAAGLRRAAASDNIEKAAGFEGRLLRTREVALLFQVSERAVTDWARKGRIPSVRTPGGHRRYPADEVRALLERSTGQTA